MEPIFDSETFIRRLGETGMPPASAAALAALFEEFAAGKHHIERLEQSVRELGQLVEAGTQATIGAIRSQTAPLLPQKTFHETMRKAGYRAYLENLQFTVLCVLLAAIAAVGALIFWRLA
jgi:hypothetical protein